jgi:type I restriction enzyme S subunit
VKTLIHSLRRWARRGEIPAIRELQRIADCVTTLDAQIAAEADKLAALKTHKQGVIQQLFPSAEAEKG